MKSCLAAFSLVVLIGSLAWADDPVGKSPTVIGRGQAEVKKAPEFLRVQLEVVVRGKDLKDALARLKDRREEMKKKLTQLEAVAESIDIGAATLTANKTAQQVQMERMMMMERFRNLPPRVAKPKQPDPVFVAVNLQADWALPAGDADTLLLKAKELQDKIQSADLAGLKDLDQQATPAEVEIDEENFGNEQSKRGEPVFRYVARISNAEREQGLARAYQSARAEAERSARAAGVSLGGLLHLESDLQTPADFSPEDEMRIQRYGMPLPDASRLSSTGEALGAHPGRLTFRVSVLTHFALKDAAGK